MSTISPVNPLPRSSGNSGSLKVSESRIRFITAERTGNGRGNTCCLPRLFRALHAVKDVRWSDCSAGGRMCQIEGGKQMKRFVIECAIAVPPAASLAPTFRSGFHAGTVCHLTDHLSISFNHQPVHPIKAICRLDGSLLNVSRSGLNAPHLSEGVDNGS